VLKKSVWPYARFTRFITRFIPLLRAYNIFTTVKDSEFLSFKKEQKPLLPAYDILRSLLPVSFPSCDPIRFYAGVWTASKAQLRKERRERNPSYSVLCRFIYPNLN
jgi:hypothetical protein